MLSVLCISMVVGVGVHLNNSRKPDLIIPKREEIIKEGYPKNEAGQTYGIGGVIYGEPELLLAIGEDDVQGYVKSTDLVGDLPESLNINWKIKFRQSCRIWCYIVLLKINNQFSRLYIKIVDTKCVMQKRFIVIKISTGILF